MSPVILCGYFSPKINHCQMPSNDGRIALIIKYSYSMYDDSY